MKIGQLERDCKIIFNGQELSGLFTVIRDNDNGFSCINPNGHLPNCYAGAEFIIMKNGKQIFSIITKRGTKILSNNTWNSLINDVPCLDCGQFCNQLCGKRKHD